jgi:hypothetical protein
MVPILNDPWRPPFKIFAVNAWHGARDRLLGKKRSLDPSEPVKIAEQWAGAKLDEPLPPAYHALVNAFNEERDISFLGHEMMKFTLAHGITNRIQIKNFLAENAHIAEEPIERPLFIVGFPRTGTTLLFNLLAQYPGARVPLYWELQRPVPPPLADERNTDPRIRQAESDLGIFYKGFPKMRMIHEHKAQGPEECLFLLRNSFTCVSYALVGDMTAYTDWLLGHDMTEDYHYYRRQLQLLQSGTPGNPWILKSPVHLRQLNVLLKVFPDANIVQTHRDPESFMPSVCSMHATFKRVYKQKVNYRRIGKIQLDLMKNFLDRAMEARSVADPKRFFDVKYADMVADPFGTAHRIMEHFGYPEKAGYDARMTAWLAENRQDKHGKHAYTLEQFGLDAETIRTTFSKYRQRFLE